MAGNPKLTSNELTDSGALAAQPPAAMTNK